MGLMGVNGMIGAVDPSGMGAYDMMDDGGTGQNISPFSLWLLLFIGGPTRPNWQK